MQPINNLEGNFYGSQPITQNDQMRIRVRPRNEGFPRELTQADDSSAQKKATLKFN